MANSYESDMIEAIKVIDLNFSYPDKMDVIKNISIDINNGESIGIVGPNGAGKTTFFHLLCGILEPTSGDIYIFGNKRKGKMFNPDVGYVFQNPDDQLFNTTVYEDIAFGPINLGFSKDEVKERVNYALNITNCKELSSRPPHHLSGGEKRMAAIATIIAMKPEIIIYDEPSSNLDMRSRRDLINFVNSSKTAKLIASHDLEFILETCHRVVVLDHGMIVADGESREIMNNEDFMLEHGLERPHSLLHGRNHKHSI